MRLASHLLGPVCVLLVPLTALGAALGGSAAYAFLTYWLYPNGTQIYSKGDPIHIHAGYQLPPDWVMNVYATIDGEEYPGYVAISNAGETATRTGTLSWLITADVATGKHDMTLSVYAAARCAFAATSTCPRTAETYRPNIVYPHHGFVVGEVVLAGKSASSSHKGRYIFPKLPGLRKIGMIDG